MFKEILHFNGKDFVVTLTRKAMIEIEEFQKRKSKAIAKDEDSIEIIARSAEIEEIQKEIAKIEKLKDSKAKNEKLAESMKEYLPLVIKMQASDVMDDPINPYDMVYILIHNYPRNEQLTKEEYENGLFELEEKLGLIELEKKVRGISDKVFREIGLIKKALEQPVDQDRKIN